MPVIKKIHDYDANYIFKVKPGSHKTLMDNIAKSTKEKISVKSLRGNELIIEWVNEVKLYSS